MQLDQETHGRGIRIGLDWDPVIARFTLQLTTTQIDARPKVSVFLIERGLEMAEIVGCISVTFATWVEHPAPVAHVMLQQGLDVLSDQKKKRKR